MHLIEADGSRVEVPPEIQSAVKAMASDPKYRDAVRFVIETLCGRHRISFVAGLANTQETMIWFEGRRYVGEMLGRMIERAIESPAPERQPRPRSVTEKVARRNRNSTTT